jgi:MoaA/NifB/PqqE/SkfB family radical SAM enzyme
MKHYLSTPVTLQMEISSMCNALCLGCARTDTANYNTKRPNIPKKQFIDLDTIRKIFQGFTTVTELDFCGTVDDPFMHPYFNQVLEIALDCGIKRVIIHTNGGARQPEYFRETSRILQQFESAVIRFNIDGLSDTNHLYRQNTKYKRIIENATAFIQEGGQAEWQFLVFPWNKHQLQEAEDLANSMGFDKFQYRVDRSNASEIGLDKINLAKTGTKMEAYHFTPERLMEKTREFEDNEISCHFSEDKMYFIDFNARLWPCCFLRNQDFFGDGVNHGVIVNNNMYKVYDDPDWNRLDINSVTDVLNHPFYANDLIESFDAKYGLGRAKKITKCAMTCGKKARARDKDHHMWKEERENEN